MRVPINQLTLPEQAAAYNPEFKRECMRTGNPVYDKNRNIVALDIDRIPLQRAFHKCMMRHMGYTGAKIPPMSIEMPLPKEMPPPPVGALDAVKKTGVGTELKTVLNQYGFVLSPIYDILMYKLNDKSITDCAQNIEGMLDVLEDEAYRNKVTFDRDKTEIMIRLAIRNARKNSNGS
jgi:hypothetical protein